ncbi:MAG: DUF2723 domain-containing protein [Bacteroidales bacterium]|nr:DUF2723 domain-containing protein [Bacteroidales bacterium]
MKQYKLLNNLFGWVAFAIAAYTYLSTVEPTASFWDCPEFITCADKGEVGHPPGNTFFNLTGRFFVNFAGGDVTQAAIWVNRMSAMFSAATILFLFWTITALTKKFVCRNNAHAGTDREEMSWGQIISVLGAGMVGSLVYTWSDTFWFSAVEAEVYAFSSFMTALVFWLILKWERHASGVEGDRYIILLAYIIGLSIGVHLLNLLSLPAIVLVYYFKKKPNATLLGSLGALIISVLLIFFILYGMIPGMVKLASATELFFVNSLGFSFNTGTGFYFFFVLIFLAVGIFLMYRKETSDRTQQIMLILGITLSGVPFAGDGWLIGIIVTVVLAGLIFYFGERINARLTSNILLCLLTILVGYSTFAQIIIRSSAQLPMDQNSPDEIFSFTKYLNREQYGESPLFFGQTFASSVLRDKNGQVISEQGAPLYGKKVKMNPNEPDRYELTGYREKYNYNYTMLFPRMYSNQTSPNHVGGYKEWCNWDEKDPGHNVIGKDGKSIKGVPTFADNLTYFINYQVNFIYWRYFMWNFSGRESDAQSYGEIDRGRAISGIPIVDELLFDVPDQSTLPSSIANNKGHNVFYMLPLLLGLIGLFYQAFAGREGIQGFWVVFFLFFMTGLAIVIYLNQTPYQPRERDYAYAGSFYAFSIWCGMGVVGVAALLQKILRNPVLAGAAASVLCLLVPVQMVGQTWDDHDRSGRYTARDFGRNYLSSLEPNAIIFTNGDNDTFPLWYAQEVEGYRTDVRVCNLSYLQTDWYINQMKSQAYDSDPLPIELRRDQYAHDKLNFAHLVPLRDGEQPLHAAMNFLYSDDPKYKNLPNYGKLDYLPAKVFGIDVNPEEVLASPCISVKDSSELITHMSIDLSGKNYVTKNEIAVLSMIDGISRTGWKRPIYFATTVGRDMYMGLDKYFRLVGLAYQIVPLANGGTSSPDIDKSYDNLMNKFIWGNIQDTTIYLDENNRRMCRTQRMMFCTLIEQLLSTGDMERALKATEYCDQTIPAANVPYEYTSLTLAQAYYLCGKPEEGDRILRAIIGSNVEYLDWAFSLDVRHMRRISNQIREQLLTMRDALNVDRQHNKGEFAKEYDAQFRNYFEKALSTYKLL